MRKAGEGEVEGDRKIYSLQLIEYTQMHIKSQRFSQWIAPLLSHRVYLIIELHHPQQIPRDCRGGRQAVCAIDPVACLQAFQR